MTGICSVGDTSITSSFNVQFLGFQLSKSSSGSITVSARSQLCKLFASANALLCIPRCPAPHTCVLLLTAFSIAHADYVLQAADFISARDIQLLETHSRFAPQDQI